MKKKSIVSLFLALTLLFSACKKEENYESKNLPVESVFDNVDSENKSKNEEEKTEDQSLENEEDKTDDQSDQDLENKEDNDNNVVENEDEEETTITTETVNIRSTPEFGDNVVDQIEAGTEFTILEKNIGENDAWAKIVYQDKVYYISMEFIN